MVHSTAPNSSDNLLSYPPDNHHSSNDVYWRDGNQCSGNSSGNNEPSYICTLLRNSEWQNVIEKAQHTAFLSKNK